MWPMGLLFLFTSQLTIRFRATILEYSFPFKNLWTVHLCTFFGMTFSFIKIHFNVIHSPIPVAFDTALKSHSSALCVSFWALLDWGKFSKFPFRINLFQIDLTVVSLDFNRRTVSEVLWFSLLSVKVKYFTSPLNSVDFRLMLKLRYVARQLFRQFCENQFIKSINYSGQYISKWI